MIQIDIEMPESCYVCKFRKSVYGSLCTCMLNEEKYYETETYKNKRSDWCPLKEMQEPCDCISKEEVLNCIEAYCNDLSNEIGMHIRTNELLDTIRQLPSVNPQPKTEWIPVSERLPKEAYGCLVTVFDTDVKTQKDFENILPYFVGYDGETWNNADGEPIQFEVIAWMPLPNPYKPTYSDCNSCKYQNEVDGSNCYECVKGIRNNYTADSEKEI